MAICQAFGQRRGYGGAAAASNLRRGGPMSRSGARQVRAAAARRSCGGAAVVLVQGIQLELEHIKSWIRERFENRKRLIGMDEGTGAADEDDRPRFCLDLAIMLAGFAFEAYNSPPQNIGIRETDGQKCETTYMSDGLIRELYKGQLTVKLEKGANLPGLDLWGTSDPYVWLRVGDCAKQSKTVIATKDPVWNETLILNVADPSTQSLKIAAWDANLLSAHKRLGNYEIKLDSLCDGATHDIEMELEGMGGGGSLFLKVQYKSFGDIDKEHQLWKVPFISDFIKSGLGTVLTSILGSDGIKVQDFVVSTIGSLHLLPSTSATNERLTTNEVLTDHQEASTETSSNGADFMNGIANAMKNSLEGIHLKPPHLWNFHDEHHESLKESGSNFQTRAEASYLEKRLVHPNGDQSEEQIDNVADVLPDVAGKLFNMSGRVEEILGSWLMLALGHKNGGTEDQSGKSIETLSSSTAIDDCQREQMREMFKRAETAMEAWAILSTALGRTSFVRSEFQKICFLESKNTDTQVAVWRDLRGKRLVVAFRGTEQDKWRDLTTDLMLAPTGLTQFQSGASRR